MMIIRKATAEDAPGLLPLIRAHAAFERTTATLGDDVLDDLLRHPEPPVHLFVADTEEIAGYAAVTFDYALWQGARTGHLDCLFVAGMSRRSGIGSRLLSFAAQFARDAGAVWLEWQTPRWNADAVRFYVQNGAKRLKKERFRLPL
jgi:GNAT superfamily N-acetyltransferase